MENFTISSMEVYILEISIYTNRYKIYLEVIKMGCDIHGFVEVNQFPQQKNGWYAIIDIAHLVGRNYDMFGQLFGIRNYTGFKPIAPDRGVPKLLSWTVREELEKWDGDGHSHTYLTLEDIEKINWDEESKEYDERVHIYKLDKNGNREDAVFAKAGWSSILDSHKEELEKNKQVIVNDHLYIYEKEKREDALSTAWVCLFDLMRTLAKHYCKENVRMVIWFDN
jgi:hypothetical protein